MLQHVLKQNSAQSTALFGFVNVEIQDARRLNVTSFAELIKDVEGLAADFEESNDQTAKMEREIY